MAPTTPLECAMSVPASVPAGQPVELSFQLTNHTAQPLYVLGWRTPLEGTWGNNFHVTRDGGTEIPYQGPMKKRANPTAQNYVTIAPGASVDGKVDLSQAYDMKQPGHYRIVFQGYLLDVTERQTDVPRTPDAFQAREVQCPAVETTITAP